MSAMAWPEGLEAAALRGWMLRGSPSAFAAALSADPGDGPIAGLFPAIALGDGDPPPPPAGPALVRLHGRAYLVDSDYRRFLDLKSAAPGEWRDLLARPRAPWPGPAGKLAGRIAVVTGAAQGFGAGLAEGLLRDGAIVVIADINREKGEALRDSLNAATGGRGAWFQALDASREESFDALRAFLLAELGGVDLFVSNAGILKAGSLEELAPKDFRLVTEINYVAYFLGARALARVMRAQARLSPAHRWTDMVQINSKSGLQGSNKNSAYAGGKFGGIGLTQSFALELVGDRIKVNAICPGNFFEGPLWTDPEKGLFVQYLRAGKVPGARTVEDVKRFYESKVPMDRGCRVEDVSKALRYVVEQDYETGQALPVTGGQVMLG